MQFFSGKENKISLLCVFKRPNVQKHLNKLRQTIELGSTILWNNDKQALPGVANIFSKKKPKNKKQKQNKKSRIQFRIAM